MVGGKLILLDIGIGAFLQIAPICLHIVNAEFQPGGFFSQGRSSVGLFLARKQKKLIKTRPQGGKKFRVLARAFDTEDKHRRTQR